MKRPAYEDSLLEDTVYEGRLEEEKGTDGRCIYKLSGHEAPAALEFVMEEAETGFIGIAFHRKGRSRWIFSGMIIWTAADCFR